MPIYKNEKKVLVEALGKLIAKSLVKNYKAVGLDKSFITQFGGIAEDEIIVKPFTGGVIEL